MSARLLRDRSGMTLAELLIALIITSLVVTTALSFVQRQQSAFSRGAGQLHVVQNYRFAADLLERNLRTVGVGVVPSQPLLVYADSDVVAFNADYASRDPASQSAVYTNPTALPDEVDALTVTHRITLPRTGFLYPDTTYGLSLAETIIFYFAPDASTSRTDDYILYRQSNDQAPEVVARNLVRSPGLPFFSYLESVPTDSGTAYAEWAAPATLPLRHTMRRHLAPSDTGQFARIDRIRAVRVDFTSTNGERGSREQRQAVERLVRMPNAGLAPLQTCGRAPLPASAPSVSQDPSASAEAIDIAWNASSDDGGGEGDVVRYSIYRAVPGASEWGEPIFSIPAGQTSYSFSDQNVSPGDAYVYGVAAQDCTPTSSSMVASAEITVQDVP